MVALHIVIPFGYGCHLLPELRGYLDRIVDFANKNEPDCFLFCGGFTQRKSAPGVSEAALMRGYVIPRLMYVPARVLLEEDSYTTQDNGEKMAKTIHAECLMDKKTKLTVCCEAIRALKVDYAVRHYLGRRADIETASWELMSPFKQLIGTIYECIAVHFPPLAWYFRNKRIRRAEQI